jgi:hypothetical protein
VRGPASSINRPTDTKGEARTTTDDHKHAAAYFVKSAQCGVEG